MASTWKLRPATSLDAQWMAELRALVLHRDLDRLGRFDPHRVRRRFLEEFRPANTSVIEVAASPVGLIAVRPESDALWIEHFYLDPGHQGRGIGSAVLAQVLADVGGERTVRLNVLQGSPARRLYERHGFAVESQDPIDVIMVRPADGRALAG